jgi:hypothetical protein
MRYTWRVIEHIPDGGTWRHGFHSERDARKAAEAMQACHRSRRYDVEEMPS